MWILGAGVVVIALLAGLATWSLIGGRTTLSPQQKLAALVKDASPVSIA